MSVTWSAEFRVGDHVVCPGIAVVRPVGVVTKVRWAGVGYGWAYAVLWLEVQGDAPVSEVARVRNRDDEGQLLRWQEARLALAGQTVPMKPPCF
jgi:hypothetical protein